MRGQETDGGAASGEALGISMAWDVRLAEGKEPVEEGEVTGEIISNKRSVKREHIRLDGVGVFECLKT